MDGRCPCVKQKNDGGGMISNCDIAMAICTPTHHIKHIDARQCKLDSFYTCQFCESPFSPNRPRISGRRVVIIESYYRFLIACKDHTSSRCVQDLILMRVLRCYCYPRYCLGFSFSAAGPLYYYHEYYGTGTNEGLMR
jgi:hypothetical protein